MRGGEFGAHERYLLLVIFILILAFLAGPEACISSGEGRGFLFTFLRDVKEIQVRDLIIRGPGW